MAMIYASLLRRTKTMIEAIMNRAFTISLDLFDN
jgi:hypothetical protein